MLYPVTNFVPLCCLLIFPGGPEILLIALKFMAPTFGWSVEVVTYVIRFGCGPFLLSLIKTTLLANVAQIYRLKIILINDYISEGNY